MMRKPVSAWRRTLTLLGLRWVKKPIKRSPVRHPRIESLERRELFTAAPLMATTPVTEQLERGGGVLNMTQLVAGMTTYNGEEGIAIVGTDLSHGTLQYSTNSGSTWTNVGTVSASSALLLADSSSTELRLEPTDAYIGDLDDAITFRAWDQVSGTNGTKVDTTTNGGTTAFSTDSAQTSIEITSMVGSPISVSTDGVEYYDNLVTAVDGRGTSVVSWQDAGSFTVMAQFYNAGGSAIGSAFTVPDSDESSMVAVSANADGTFAFVLQGEEGIEVVRYQDVDGSIELLDTSPLVVAHWTGANSTDGLFVGIGVTESGGFDVGYSQSSGSTELLQVRQYDSSGTPLADGPITAVSINSGSYGLTGAQMSVAPDGSFALAWLMSGSGSNQYLQAMQFDSSGVAQQESPIGVASVSSGTLTLPTISLDGAGGFVVSWMENDGGDNSILKATHYDSSGTGNSFTIDTTANFQTGSYYDDLASQSSVNAGGNWGVVWTSSVSGNLMGRFYNSDDEPLGDAFAINNSGAANSWFGLGSNAQGDLVATWAETDGETSTNFYAQRLQLNQAPSAGTIPDLSISASAAATTISLSSYFSDPDTSYGDSLSYSASSSNSTEVSPSISGDELILNHSSTSDGSATITVKATDSTGKFVTASFLVTVSGIIVPIVIDNGGTGYSESGPGWNDTGSVPGYYGGSGRYDTNNSGTASWTATSLPSGTYEVLVSWGGYSVTQNNATNAGFTVYDGSTSLATKTINEDLAPNSANVDGQLYQSLGIFTVSSGTLKVKTDSGWTSLGGNNWITTDSVRIVELAPSTTPTIGSLGANPSSVMQGGHLTLTAYDVNGTDSSDAGDITSVAYYYDANDDGSLNSGDTLLGTATSGTNGWALTTTNTFPIGTDRFFAVAYAANGTSAAVSTTAQVVAVPTVIDPESAAGFNPFGSRWTSETGSGAYGGTDYYTKYEAQTLAWTFDGIANGAYQVFATYPTNSGNAPDAQFTLYNGGTAASTSTIDEQTTLTGNSYGGQNWVNLGDVNVTTGLLNVGLGGTWTSLGDGNEWLAGDAVRVVPLDPPTLASISNQSVDLGDTVSLTASATASNTGQTIAYSLESGAPSGASINASTGIFNWTPTSGQTPGTYAVTVEAIEDGIASESATRTFNVTVGYQPPTTTGLPDVSTHDGAPAQSINLSTYFSDPDSAYGDSLSYSASSGNTGLVTTNVDDGELVLDYSDTNSGEAAVTVTATNSTGASVSTIFNVSLSGLISPIVIDNGGTGYSESGPGWNDTGSVPGYYGGSGRYDTNNSGTASWTATSLPSGTYEVLVSWGGYSVTQNNATNAGFTVYDGSTSLATKTINEDLAPNSANVDGQLYQSLGIFTVSSGTLKVKTDSGWTSLGGNNWITTDSVRIVELAPSTTPTIGSLGANPSSVMQGGHLTLTAYDVNGTDSSDAGDITSVAYYYDANDDGSLNSGDTLLGTATSGTNGWALTTTNTFPIGTDRFFAVAYAANGTSAAVSTTAQVVAVPTVIDPESAAGFNPFGSRWTSETGSGAYGGTDYYTKYEAQTLAWTFDGIANGAYQVFATYPTNSGNAPDAQFTLYNGGTAASTSTIDEQTTLTGNSYGGQNWVNLGDVNVTTGLLNVGLGGTWTSLGDGNEWLAGDAVRVVPLDPPTLASISNQSVDLGDTVSLTASATASNTGQTIAYSLESGAPSGASINASTGIFNWTPTSGQTPGTYAVTVEAIEDGIASESATRTFNVTVGYQPPTTTGLPDVSTHDGAPAQSINLSTYFSDPDSAYGDSLSYSASSGNTGLVTTNVDDGELVLDYSDTNSGEAAVTVTATNSTGASVSTIFNVSLTPVASTSTTTPGMVDLDRGTQVFNVSQLLVGTSLSNSWEGVAITGVNLSEGTLKYSTNYAPNGSGTTWTTIPNVSDVNALLLADNTSTEFQFTPSNAYEGLLTNAILFRGWDQTSGTAGTYAAIVPNGDSTAFSSGTAQASLDIMPMVGAPAQLVDSAQNSLVSAINNQGASVVAWYTPGTGNVEAQFYYSNGTPVPGGPIQVNPSDQTVGKNVPISVSASSDGDFIISWYDTTATTPGVAISRFTSSGAPDLPDSASYLSTGVGASMFAVAATAGGGFNVVYSQVDEKTNPTTGLSAPYLDLYTIHYNGSSWTTTTSDPTSLGGIPDVVTVSGVNRSAQIESINAATASDGSSVVEWMTETSGVGYQIYAIQSNAAATPGTPFQIGTTYNDTGFLNGPRDFAPSLTLDGQGGFITSWQQEVSSTNNTQEIVANHYNGRGNLQDSFVVATSVGFNGLLTSSRPGSYLAADAAGDWGIIWRATTNSQLMAQVFNANDQSLGPAFDLNTPVGSVNTGMSLSTDPAGNFLAAWSTSGLIDVQTMQLGVQLAPIPNQTATVGSPVTVSVSLASSTSLSDAPGLYSLGPGSPAGATINPNTGVVHWTPKENQVGDQTISVLVGDKDNPGLAGGQTINVSVSGHAPTASTIPNLPLPPSGGHTYAITEGQAPTFIQLGHYFSDPDISYGDSLTYSVSESGDSAVVSPKIIGNELELSYPASSGGTAGLTITASDDAGLSVSTSFSVSVTAGTPSFVKGGDVSVLENSTAYAKTDWATNIYFGSVGTGTFTVTNTANGLFTSSGQPSISPAGTLTFTPQTGMVGSAVVSVTVNGGGLSSRVQTFTIALNANASTPIATDLSYTAVKGATLSVNATAGVLTGASDADGETLTAVSEDVSTTYGSVSVESDGAFTYTPTSSYTGTGSFTDTFAYAVTDGTNPSQSATVTLTIVPSALTANSDSYGNVTAGNTFSIGAAEGVLADDTAVSGYSLTAHLVSGPAHDSSFSLSPNGAFTYTPGPGYAGSDSFTYDDTDGGITSNVVTVTLTSQPPITAIPLTSVYNSVSDGTEETIALSSAFSDSGNLLTYSIAGNNNAGQVSASISGSSLILSFSNSTSATDDITVVAANESGLSTSNTLTFLVNEGTPSAPTIYDIPNVTLDAGASTSVDLSQYVSDAADPHLTYSLSAVGSQSLLQNHTFSGQTLSLTASSNLGTEQLVLTAEDSWGQSTVATFDLEVEPDAPQISSSSLSLAYDLGSSTSHFANDPTLGGEIDLGDNLDPIEVEFELDGNLAATVPVDAHGNFSYSPAGLTTGTYTVAARAEDETTGATGSWTSLTFTLEADAAPTVVSLGLTNDTGGSTSDPTTSDPTLQGSVSWGGQSNANQQVQFEFNGDTAIDGTTVTDASGSFTFQPIGLSQGQVVVEARAVAWDATTDEYDDGPWASFTFTLSASPTTDADSSTAATAENSLGQTAVSQSTEALEQALSAVASATGSTVSNSFDLGIGAYNPFWNESGANAGADGQMDDQSGVLPTSGASGVPLSLNAGAVPNSSSFSQTLDVSLTSGTYSITGSVTDVLIETVHDGSFAVEATFDYSFTQTASTGQTETGVMDLTFNTTSGTYSTAGGTLSGDYTVDYSGSDELVEANPGSTTSQPLASTASYSFTRNETNGSFTADPTSADSFADFTQNEATSYGLSTSQSSSLSQTSGTGTLTGSSAGQLSSSSYSATQSETGSYQQNSSGDFITVPTYSRSASGSVSASYDSPDESYTTSSSGTTGSGSQLDDQSSSQSYSHVESGGFSVSGATFNDNIASFADTLVSNQTGSTSWAGTVSTSGSLSGSVDPIETSGETISTYSYGSSSETSNNGTVSGTTTETVTSDDSAWLDDTGDTVQSGDTVDFTDTDKESFDETFSISGTFVGTPTGTSSSGTYTLDEDDTGSASDKADEDYSNGQSNTSGTDKGTDVARASTEVMQSGSYSRSGGAVSAGGSFTETDNESDNTADTDSGDYASGGSFDDKETESDSGTDSEHGSFSQGPDGVTENASFNTKVLSNSTSSTRESQSLSGGAKTTLADSATASETDTAYGTYSIGPTGNSSSSHFTTNISGSDNGSTSDDGTSDDGGDDETYKDSESGSLDNTIVIVGNIQVNGTSTSISSTTTSTESDSDDSSDSTDDTTGDGATEDETSNVDDRDNNYSVVSSVTNGNSTNTSGSMTSTQDDTSNSTIKDDDTAGGNTTDTNARDEAGVSAFQSVSFNASQFYNAGGGLVEDFTASGNDTSTDTGSDDTQDTDDTPDAADGDDITDSDHVYGNSTDTTTEHFIQNAAGLVITGTSHENDQAGFANQASDQKPSEGGYPAGDETQSTEDSETDTSSGTFSDNDGVVSSSVTYTDNDNETDDSTFTESGTDDAPAAPGQPNPRVVVDINNQGTVLGQVTLSASFFGSYSDSISIDDTQQDNSHSHETGMVQVSAGATVTASTSYHETDSATVSNDGSEKGSGTGNESQIDSSTSDQGSNSVDYDSSSEDMFTEDATFTQSNGADNQPDTYSSVSFNASNTSSADSKEQQSILHSFTTALDHGGYSNLEIHTSNDAADSTNFQQSGTYTTSSDDGLTKNSVNIGTTQNDIYTTQTAGSGVATGFEHFQGPWEGETTADATDFTSQSYHGQDQQTDAGHTGSNTSVSINQGNHETSHSLNQMQYLGEYFVSDDGHSWNDSSNSADASYGPDDGEIQTDKTSGDGGTYASVNTEWNVSGTTSWNHPNDSPPTTAPYAYSGPYTPPTVAAPSGLQGSVFTVSDESAGPVAPPTPKNLEPPGTPGPATQGNPADLVGLNACFVAGTPVLTSEGFKPIERISRGDRVLAARDDDAQGPISYQDVVDVYHNPPAPVVNVHLDDQVIRCTAMHPFYVVGRGWVGASELAPGDRLVSSAAGEIVLVTEVFDNGDVEPVFNFHVPNGHTYFVATPNCNHVVLVHNSSAPTLPVNPAQNGEGHHYVPNGSVSAVAKDGLLTPEEIAYFGGRSSGPLSAGHPNVWGPEHQTYNNAVEQELRAWKAAENSKDFSAEVVANNIKAGKSWDGSQTNKTINDFNGKISAHTLNAKYDTLPNDKVIAKGKATARVQKLLTKLGFILGVAGIIGKISDGSAIAGILNPDNADAHSGIRRAQAALTPLKLKSALIGLAGEDNSSGYPSVYEELLVVDRGFALAFKAAVEKALANGTLTVGEP
jgi:Pretoxin HINT domain/Bacterial Ig domain